MADELAEAREAIDAADRQMAALFAERMKAVAQIAAYKAERGLAVYDAEREAEVVVLNSMLVDEGIRPYYTRFLEATMAVSRQYQHRLMEGVRVAYAGVEGAFAWVAARAHFPDADLVAYPDFRSAYNAVAAGECDCAVLPVENSEAGEVGQVTDLLFNGHLFVNRVIEVAVRQNLLGIPGAKLEDIKTVASHPQALAQCSEYLGRHAWTLQEAVNTATAAKAVAEAGDPSTAAIASTETARLYGLAVLDHDINESATNTTLFAVVSQSVADGTGERFMLMFTVKNEAGALAQAIHVIGKWGFNMHALRSRPMKSLAWQYYFCIEAEGDIDSEEGWRMMEELAEQCDRLKVVGRYSVRPDIERPAEGALQ
jgi:chorismate mutase/prephenate dehydratase